MLRKIFVVQEIDTLRFVNFKALGPSVLNEELAHGGKESKIMEEEERKNRRYNVEVALDDFIGFCLSVGKENIEENLRLTIEKTEEKLFWYKLLLEGIRERERKRNN